MADVAGLMMGDVDFDEVWPDGEVIIDAMVERGFWVYAERSSLTFSGRNGSEAKRTNEPPPRKEIRAFHSPAEAKMVGALAIARHRKNKAEAEERRNNPHWPLRLDIS
jgi:hypothetical protein